MKVHHQVTMSDTMKNSFNQINKPAIVPEYFTRLFMIRKRISVRITHNIICRTTALKLHPNTQDLMTPHDAYCIDI